MTTKRTRYVSIALLGAFLGCIGACNHSDNISGSCIAESPSVVGNLEKLTLGYPYGFLDSMDLYLSSNAVLHIQVITEECSHEERYEGSLSATEFRAIEQALEDHGFLCMESKEATYSQPDSGTEILEVTLLTGESQTVSKSSHYSYKAFDTLFASIVTLAEKTNTFARTYSGPWDNHWRPDGF